MAPDPAPNPSSDPDADLLSRFLTGSDPAAFSQLLHRHGPMVLGICRRVLSNPADAEDAFQATFLVLAMRARSVRDPHMLPAWLWSVARQSALKIHETARRRQSAERRAAQWTAMTHPIPADVPDPELQSLLDRELDRLTPRHRAAVVLCYIEGTSNRDAARLLGVPIGTLVSRLREARQILRRRFARLGYGVDPESLPQKLSQSLAPSMVPEALLVTTSSAVSHLNTTATGAAVSLQVAKSVVKLMAYSKAKTTVAAALILFLFTGGAATLVYHLVRTPPEETASTTSLKQPPAGPTMWPSPPQSRPAYTGGPITGYVRTADGRPVAGAVVAYGTEDQPVIEMFHFPWGRSNRDTRTGADGHFKLIPTESPNVLFARTGDSFGQIPIGEISSSSDIVLRPLGRIEGVAKSGSKPAAYTRILLMYVIHNGNNQRWLEQGPEVMADADGRFTFEGIIPGTVNLGLTLANSGGFNGTPAPMEVKSGSTVTVTLGGGGRTVVGRFTPALAAERRDVHLSDTPPEVIRKIFESGKTAEERKALIAEARRQPDVDRFYTAPHWVVAHVEADGSFRCEDVQPGKYTLSATWMTMPDTLATAKTDVVVPASSTGGDDALNLGAFPLDIAPRLKVGETVPDLAGMTADGKPVKITDYRGKFLLYFVLNPNVVTWLEVTKAMAIRDRFRTDDRFRMATFYYPVIAQSARPDLLDWPVASMGEYRDQLPPVYRFTFARIILIDPEGRFVANSINAPGIVEAVEAALRAPASADPAMGKIDITHREAGASPEGLADSPSAINLAATSTFAVADGVPTRTANALSRLTDGKLASNDDAPSQNFFFEVGTLEGRLKLDLGKSISVGQIETYSRHKGARAPQLYNLYATDGSAPNFDPSPRIGTDPVAHGWTRLATVDTRPQSGPVGGSYTVKISNTPAALGTFRYLLFEIFPTETQDPFGHTFFSEIRVLEHP